MTKKQDPWTGSSIFFFLGHPWKLQFIFNSPLEIPHAISLIPNPEIPYPQTPLPLFHNFSFFYFIPTGNSRQNRAPLLHPWKFHKFLLDPLEIPRSKSKTLEIQYFCSWSPLEILLSTFC